MPPSAAPSPLPTTAAPSPLPFVPDPNRTLPIGPWNVSNVRALMISVVEESSAIADLNQATTAQMLMNLRDALDDPLHMDAPTVLAGMGFLQELGAKLLIHSMGISDYGVKAAGDSLSNFLIGPLSWRNQTLQLGRNVSSLLGLISSVQMVGEGDAVVKKLITENIKMSSQNSIIKNLPGRNLKAPAHSSMLPSLQSPWVFTSALDQLGGTSATSSVTTRVVDVRFNLYGVENTELHNRSTDRLNAGTLLQDVITATGFPAAVEQSLGQPRGPFLTRLQGAEPYPNASGPYTNFMCEKDWNGSTSQLLHFPDCPFGPEVHRCVDSLAIIPENHWIDCE